MKDKIKLDLILTIYIILNMVYVLIGSYLSFNNIILMQNFSYGYIPLLIINIIFIIILFLKKKYKPNIVDIFLLSIVAFACISTIFAYKPMKALFGTYNRYEGLFVILYYISILFLTSFVSKENKKKIIYFILLFGLIECIYGIFQKLELFNIKTLLFSLIPR